MKIFLAYFKTTLARATAIPGGDVHLADRVGPGAADLPRGVDDRRAAARRVRRRVHARGFRCVLHRAHAREPLDLHLDHVGVRGAHPGRNPRAPHHASGEPGGAGSGRQRRVQSLRIRGLGRGRGAAGACSSGRTSRSRRSRSPASCRLPPGVRAALHAGVDARHGGLLDHAHLGAQPGLLHDHAVPLRAGGAARADPGFVQHLARLLPFRWMLSFPLDVLLGRTTGADVFLGYGVQLVWLACSVVAARFAWRAGVRQFSAVDREPC